MTALARRLGLAAFAALALAPLAMGACEDDEVTSCDQQDWEDLCQRCGFDCGNYTCFSGAEGGGGGVHVLPCASLGTAEPCTLCGEDHRSIACDTALTCLEQNPDAGFWSHYGKSAADGGGGSGQ
jgi:hypothetical protein